MLTQLATVKTRLAISAVDTQYDSILTRGIAAVSAQFENVCCRTFGRTVDATEEFSGEETEVLVACYPLETVARFEVKSSETEGWTEQPDISYLVRQNCIISLNCPLGTWRLQSCVIYTGGYVLPGNTPGLGQTSLPADLEQAAVEQVACWFRNRDALGVLRIWRYQGTYEQFEKMELLPNVSAVLKTYARWGI